MMAALASSARTLRHTQELAIAFTDLAESTRLYRELGDTRAHDLTQAFHGQVALVVPEHGGRLVKTLGDGVMCAFPEADRAVLAMSTLHARMAALGDPKKPLRAHSGVSFGTTIMQGEDVFGTVVNVAAYLAAIARANQILTTQAVVDRLSAPVRSCARAAYTARLKGDDHESVVHEILWQTDRASVTDVNPAGVGPLPADEGALQLHFGGAMHRVNAFHPRFTLGREPDNDLVVEDEFVSRRHAIVEVDVMRFKLIDRSANGTYVAFDGSPGEVRVLRGETILHGSGRISLGRSLADPQSRPVEFRRDQRALYRV